MFCGPDLFAQQPGGYVSVGLDGLPNAPGGPIEMRARLFVDERLAPYEHLVLRAAAALDALGFREFVGSESELAGAHAVEFVPYDLYAEITGTRADLRVGYSRIVWGRLDEVQPTDVVNPLDLARFFFEGRSEARLAMPMLRGRLFFGERANVEAVVVPWFRRGRFDLLDEPSSPFNLETGPVTLLDASPDSGSLTAPVSRREPGTNWGNVQGGGRFSATIGRVDLATSFYRGFDAFGTYVPLPTAFVQVFQRYTMVGGDFETARGKWALRGEVAHFSGELDGLDAGVGFDRRAGEYHVSGTVLVHHEGAAACVPQDPACRATGPATDYTSTSLVAAADRTFARERYRTRTFAVYNATERATFVRNITSMEVRANVTLEGSIGWFFGSGTSQARRDVIGRFSDRDFLYARLRVHF
ncbi:MAG: hypothetical protein ACM36C_09325 [Acidobacteriota bacterium]